MITALSLACNATKAQTESRNLENSKIKHRLILGDLAYDRSLDAPAETTGTMERLDPARRAVNRPVHGQHVEEGVAQAAESLEQSKQESVSNRNSVGHRATYGRGRTMTPEPATVLTGEQPQQVAPV